MAEVFVPPSSEHAARPSPFAFPDSQDSSQSLNPDFMFPAPSAFKGSSVSHPPKPSNGPFASQPATHRRKPSNLSLNTMPPFDFNFPPHERPSPSPTRSPVRLTPPSHATGHKRGGSEFVGGDITHGGPVLVNKTSQEETAPPAPLSPAKGPPAGRRGHSHRRSHAISQHDVTSIMQPTKEKGTISGQDSPAAESKVDTRPSPPRRSKSHPEKLPLSETASTFSRASSNPGFSQARARVGFSDSLEFIPRPLSTISSETSSSMSTIRANHSVSGSVSSLLNVGTSSPPSRTSNTVQDNTSAPAVMRPDQIHKSDQSLRLGTDCQLPDSEFTADDRRASEEDMTTPVALQEHKPADDAQTSGTTDVNDFVAHETPFIFSRSTQSPAFEPVSPPLRPKTSPESKTCARQHRVKSWAETLLHRKEKLHPAMAKSVQNSATPVTCQSALAPDFTLDEMSFDNDTTTIIEEPAPISLSHAKPHKRLPPRQSDPLPHSPELSQSGPMIDLDAALSAASPSMPEDAAEFFGKGLGGKRKLHSSGETGCFSGPGMHYHRRAESAPELEPFERSRFGIPRFGSNPAMEGAIVEEEEDEDATEASNGQDSQALGLGVNIVEADPVHVEPLVRPVGGGERKEKPRVLRRISTPPDTMQLVGPIQIADVEDEPRFSMITKSSDDSSITPTVSPGPLTSQPSLVPMDIDLQTPSLTHGTTPETPSAVSSADYRKTSFDARIHTARSSMTDRMTLNSSKTGDVSAGSVDDVPSLTSSSSTMMSGFPNRFSGIGPPVHSGDRSASLSAAVPPYRSRPGSSSKRASLASLSKLMGGPYGRSKLNIEETLPSESPEKADKKRHRISRMMKFWKSKEKLSSD